MKPLLVMKPMKIRAGYNFTTQDFWYDLTKGGYLKPDDALSDKQDVLEVTKAIQTLRRFEQACIDQIEDFYQ
jgi:hypothetical protein